VNITVHGNIIRLDNWQKLIFLILVKLIQLQTFHNQLTSPEQLKHEMKMTQLNAKLD